MNRLRFTAAAVGLGLVAIGPGVSLASTASELFYERSLMASAGQRCRLFDPQTLAALSAASQQARGAALRGGADVGALDAIQARAQAKAAATPCASPDLALAAKRVRDGFAGYAKLNQMAFPGALAAWKAERDDPQGGAWRLSQSARTPAGPMLFGLAGEGQRTALTVVAGWPGALAASGARLVLRDPTLAPRAYIDPRRNDLAGRTPPRDIARAFLASGREPATAALLPAQSYTGAAFRFPDAATAALETLDPREAVTVELTYPTRDGERVERVPIEVGDFAAGRAFLLAHP